MQKKGKTVLVIDGGGRGSALVHKYSLSPQVSKIVAIPGNDLMKINSKKKVITYQNIKTTSIDEILKVCQKEKVDLVDVAQDNAVAAGLVNTLTENSINCVGPTKEAGQIEWDKAWSRNFMHKYGIPHPKFKVCHSEAEGIEFIQKQKNRSWFIKAYGLVEGKGALPAKDNLEAIEKIKEMSKFKEAGETFLIEEWLVGEEFSSFSFIDGKNFIVIGHAQDHKRINNFDEGENTGGMGACTPPLLITKRLSKKIEEIFKKTVSGLLKEMRPYKGVLYLGGIIVNEPNGSKVYVIEYNARWGDPEAQVILPGIKNDLYKISLMIIQGTLKKLNLVMDLRYRVAIAGATKGYPIDYSLNKGKVIFGLEKAGKLPGVVVYSAGIKKDQGFYKVNGGRLFYLVGVGKNVLDAKQKAYNAMSLISIRGNNLHFRTDIGWRDVERLTSHEI